MMESRPGSFRRRARECRALAQEADHLEAIGKLLKMADEFDREADRLENDGRT